MLAEMIRFDWLFLNERTQSLIFRTAAASPRPPSSDPERVCKTPIFTNRDIDDFISSLVKDAEPYKGFYSPL